MYTKGGGGGELQRNHTSDHFPGVVVEEVEGSRVSASDGGEGGGGGWLGSSSGAAATKSGAQGPRRWLNNTKALSTLVACTRSWSVTPTRNTY